MLNVSLITPAPKRSRKGNRITALRWARILRSFGHHVSLDEEYRGRSADLLIVLHAVRSHESAARFHAEHPERPLIVALTGTDLYGEADYPATDTCTVPSRTDEVNPMMKSLEIASRVIVLQSHAKERLPPALRGKTRVILQSASPPRAGATPPSQEFFDVCVVGHLRPVKDPFLAARAARLLPGKSKVRVLHLGAALTDEMRRNAEGEAKENARYRWLGECSHAEVLQTMARSKLLVLTSKVEGGANVLCEAIAAGVPVLATRIPGSTGILGDDYPGLFATGDVASLAALLRRTETDASFQQMLMKWCERLRPLVDPERERRCWQGVLFELGMDEGWIREPLLDAGTRVPRLHFMGCDTGARIAELASSVLRGLTAPRKSLPCRFFYDTEGSRLFEEICRLPEYYLTRAEEEILREHKAEIAQSMSFDVTLVELGSGSSAKTRILLEEFLRRQGHLTYVPVDISREMLLQTARTLVAEYPALEVTALAAEYAECHEALERLRTRGPMHVLWLGSNVGNFERNEAAAFLRKLGAAFKSWDRLLIGIDLRKDRSILEPAYDDAQGITAQFNRNLLRRINAELEAQFNAESFAHRAEYDVERGCIEMYLESVKAQRVRIGLLDLEVQFQAGERIHTEISCKYSLAEIDELARSSGFHLTGQWLDSAKYFSVNLFAPVEVCR